MSGVFPTAQDRPSTRDIVLERLAFHTAHGVGIPDSLYFAAQYPTYTYPCQRFADLLTAIDA